MIIDEAKNLAVVRNFYPWQPIQSEKDCGPARYVPECHLADHERMDKDVTILKSRFQRLILSPQMIDPN